MKKLFSLLTISTLTASVPAPLLANTTSTGPTKINITLPALDDDIELKLNNDYLPIKQINGIGNIMVAVVDSKDNIYFGTNGGAYKLSAGSDTPTKINGISDYVSSLVVAINNNIYFGTNNGLFVLKHNETTVEQITWKIASFIIICKL